MGRLLRHARGGDADRAAHGGGEGLADGRLGGPAGVTGRGGFGLVGDLIVGVIGAVIGGWLFRTLGASMGGGLLGSIIVATIGAIVLLVIVRLIKRA